MSEESKPGRKKGGDFGFPKEHIRLLFHSEGMKIEKEGVEEAQESLNRILKKIMVQSKQNAQLAKKKIIKKEFIIKAVDDLVRW